MLDASVSGGPHGVRGATLLIMVGSRADALERARLLSDCIGKKVFHMGERGAGHATKPAGALTMQLINGLHGRGLGATTCRRWSRR